MKASAGKKSGEVRYMELEDAFHDCVCVTWAQPERDEVLRIIGEWVGEF